MFDLCQGKTENLTVLRKKFHTLAAGIFFAGFYVQLAS